ncbi:MAG: hypothetical protein ACLVJH_14910 [Faecalibacterium prausnitzii]
MAAQTNFIDIATIWLHAGKGGDGAVSFHREKFVAAGGPDGGDGGRGGDIIFVADDHLSTLMDFRYKRKYVAPEGGKGGASLCHGKNAENLVIKVPLGTVIKDAESGLVIADLSDHTPVTIAKGGRGGYGNAHFATPPARSPSLQSPVCPARIMQVTLGAEVDCGRGSDWLPQRG